MANKQYFEDANLLGRSLRFLNLLEPGHLVLSLSKIAMWATLGLVGYSVVIQPDNILAVLGSLGALTGSTGNYMYRRYTQIQQGTNLPDSPFGPEPYEVLDDEQYPG